MRRVHPATMPARSITAAALAAVLLAGCGGPDDGSEVRLADVCSPGSAEGMNVLLVTLDTVRADRLGCYGCADAETPVCDALASSGVCFGDAVTSVPLTLPSHATILTGLYPYRHGVRENGKYRLADRYDTLAEELLSRGYDTAAFVGCFVLDESFGLDQGFDVYDFDVTAEGYRPDMPDFNERNAEAVTDSAIAWLNRCNLEETQRPFFMWVHYFDPHLPYQSPYQRLQRFASRPYDAEIAFTDYHLGRLIERLEEAGLLEETVVVVVADHGEALGEHGEPTHGMLLYEGTVRVPFIISCSALFDTAYRVSDRAVGLVDVRATIHDMLGIATDSTGDGHSLLRDDTCDRTIYIETEMPMSLAGWSPLYGLRTHRHKYVLAPEPELYDLNSDPEETRNIYASLPGVSDPLKRELEAVMSRGSFHASSEELPNDEEIERMAALSYVVVPGRDSRESRQDPKAMMGVYEEALRSEQLYSMGRIEEATAVAERVLEQSPDLTMSLRVLAFSYLKLGRAGDALQLLRSYVERVPDVYLTRSLAQLLILDGRYGEAEEVLGTYEKLDPLDGRVPLLLGDIRDRQGRPGEARELYRQALKLDERRVGIKARARIAKLETANTDG